MGHNWIIDVLDDLNTFARANGLPELADQLVEAAGVAKKEIGSKSEDILGHAPTDGKTLQSILSPVGGSGSI